MENETITQKKSFALPSFLSANRIPTIILTILILGIGCWAMHLSPIWNGEIQGHRTQYEETSVAFKEGHLWLDHDVDPILMGLENPYDPDARSEAGAYAHWDHAYYNGHYYMYFGVVPVIILFLPYLLITGHTLPTLYGTIVFFCLGVIGLCLLFSFLRKRFFSNMPYSMMLLFYASICCLSFWYIVEAPALYCTAISSGICLEIWSIYLVLKSIFDEQLSYRRASVLLVIGAFLGAGVFGCRPPIGLASLVMVPLFFKLVKNYREQGHSIYELVLKTVFPYLLVALLLMWYNYARFENPFEFGQSYQMTVADQSSYGSLLSHIDLKNLIISTVNLLFSFPGLSLDFPYLKFSGILMEFPLLLVIFKLGSKSITNQLKERKIFVFSLMMVAAFFATVVVELAMSPYLLERYKMDFNYLLGILAFVVIGAVYEHAGSAKLLKLNVTLSVLSVLSLVNTFLLFMIPNDSNFTAYFPEVLEHLIKVFP